MREDVPRIVGDVEIAKLQLRPGDVLIVKIDRPITSEIAERIAAHVKAKLPADVQCLVIESAIDLSVLTRAEIEAKAA